MNINATDRENKEKLMQSKSIKDFLIILIDYFQTKDLALTFNGGFELLAQNENERNYLIDESGQSWSLVSEKLLKTRNFLDFNCNFLLLNELKTLCDCCIDFF